jgi:ferredoxin-NADP reductase
MPLLPVREVVQATPRARIVRLSLAGSRFPYEPGQAVSVGLPGSQSASYSIAGAPHDAVRDDCLELLVGTEGNSREFQQALRPAAALDVHGPIGTFKFTAGPSARRFAFIAAGTGIAPLRAMLRHALQDGRNEAMVFYSARTPHEFAYRNELEALARSGRIDLHLSVTRYGSAPGWQQGRGRFGREHAQAIVKRGTPVCFLCGPTSFAHETSRLLINMGVSPDQVRMDDWLMTTPSSSAAVSTGLGVVSPSLASP